MKQFLILPNLASVHERRSTDYCSCALGPILKIVNFKIHFYEDHCCEVVHNG